MEEGDVIDIIAPSYKPSFELKDIVKNETLAIIKKMGFRARIANDIFDYNEDSFCANNVLYRKDKFIDAIYNTESKLIWCLQGGYGSTSFIADLDQLKQPLSPKLLLGFSDITALHIYLNSKWGWPSIHYRNLGQLYTNISTEEINNTKQFLIGARRILSYEVIPINNIFAEIEAEVIGGNLSIIATSIGTNWQIQTKNKILFIEEVDERGYAIDRMLYHLEQANIFKDIKALLIGDIICNPEKNGEMRCDLAIKNLCSRLKVPIFKINGFGHGEENGLLPFNLKCNINYNRLIYDF